MKTKPPAPATPRLPEWAQELAGRMGRVRWWRSVVIFATAGALALGVVLMAIIVEGLLDFLVVLPWWARALWLLASLAGAGWLVWKRGVCVQRQQPDDETVALMIERGLPEFRSRFISAVQLARGKPTPLVRALVAETVALARTQRLSAAIDKRALWRALAGVSGVALAGVALWVAGGGNSAPLLRRAVLSTEAAPRGTKLQVLTGNRTIGLGDDFSVEVEVSGVVPREGRWHVQPAAGRALDLPLEAGGEQRTHFQGTLARVQEPFDYFVALGDARSATFHVKVQPGPVILGVEATQKFPIYSKLPPRRVELSDLKLLAGSRLALRVKAGGPVKSGAVRLVAGERVLGESALAPEANDATQLAGEIAISTREATGLTLWLIDAEGLESRATTIYPVEVATDESPVVDIRWPEHNVSLLTPGGTMLLSFGAKDDSGLAKIRFHYAVDWAEGAPSSLAEIDAGSARPREIVRSYEWSMTNLHPPVGEGQVIDYWIEGLDTKEPAGSGVTKHYQVRMVSEFEKRADLTGRFGEIVNGLDAVRQGEEEANAKLGGMIENSPAETKAPELLRESEAKQRQLAGDVQKLASRLALMLDEYERNKLTGADTDTAKKAQELLNRLSSNEMPAAAESLQKARAAGDAGTMRKALSEAGAAQKQILAQIAPLLAEHGRQRGGFELSHALAQLADRQAANLQKAIEASKRTAVKKTESLATAMIQSSLDEQTGEQTALGKELKAVVERIGRFAKEPGHAEMTARLQQAVAEAQRVQAIVDGAAALLKQGQLFKAGNEEKAAHDALRRLARFIAPPQNPGEALHVAERDLGRMVTEETAVATEAQQAVTPENFAALESRQGRLAARSDLLAQDLAAQAPGAAQAMRAAFDKMQEARGSLLDKSSADAARHAQGALANLERARAEITALAGRAGSPIQPVVAGAAPAGQRPAAMEKHFGALAGIMEDVQTLELETAQAVAQGPPKMNDALKRLAVRLADLRAQTGDLKTALAGDPADAADALEDAGRDMGTAKSQLEQPDGPGADATERKVLADFYRAQRALHRRSVQGGEAPVNAQTLPQLAQAQATLAEAQQGFQKFEAARQSGQANARILQETATALARAAQQAGRAAAGSRAAGEMTRRTMQEAAQEAVDATAQAVAGKVPAAQEKAGAVQGKLTQVANALALEQAGLAAVDVPAISGAGAESAPPEGSKPGAATAPKGDNGPLDFTGFSPRERAALEQSQGEKHAGEYGALIEQYLRNLAGEGGRK